MSDLRKAIAIAVAAHADQVDKAGRPYILHPLRVMFRFETEMEMITAVLHDVIEDSSLSIDDLKFQGFSECIVDAIDFLTKKEGEIYEDFILRVSKNDLAKRIKIEDIKDNLNLTRLNEITHADFQRSKKYHEALRLLSGENTKDKN